jgi:hypothetical protein
MTSGTTLAMIAGALALLGICALTLTFQIIDYVEKRRRQKEREADLMLDEFEQGFWK